MPMLHIYLEGDGAFDQIAADAPSVISLENDLHVSALAQGTTSGKPTVAFGFVLPNKQMVIAQTTLALFLMAADALRARYGDPRR